jgi:hypothetical protein
MTPREREAHFNAVVAIGCLVTRSAHDVTIHHAHGGSLKERGFHRSAGHKTSDYLVLPITRRLHVGPASPKHGVYPIDGADRISVVRWERLYRPQADMIDEFGKLLGMDLWALARAEEKGMVRRAA